MAKIVSKVYGDALFELALEKQSVTALYEEAEALRKIFRDNGELMQLLTHPKISKEEKEAAVKAIFDGRVSDDMAGFLVLVVDKGRADELDAVLGYFLSVVKEYKKIGVVDVASAVELTDAQKEKLCEKLLATTDYATLEVNYRVDAALIGGLVVRIGDRVVDSSIRTKLSQMEKQLQRIQLS
ncbi:MAG: ATP synthase F1 subunit delta [Lachnospiraceae bacterium]|jgi:F-type H+-transporting ATPase subunit delta|nr:ATP synthase F1 subunit delta [Lachnospiraceae bacterium]